MSLFSHGLQRTRSWYSLVLALIIISSYVVFFGIVIFQDRTGSYDGLKTITATFGIIVAAVVGYYFGQRPVESAEQRAQEAVDQKADFKNKLGSDIKQDIEQIDADLTKHRQHKEEDSNMLENIKQILRKYKTPGNL